MIYTVDFEIHGHHYVEVEAESMEEAIESAEEICGMQDFGVLYDVDADVYSVEDENGNTHYEY
jgi:hypothetical protein